MSDTTEKVTSRRLCPECDGRGFDMHAEDKAALERGETVADPRSVPCATCQGKGHVDELVDAEAPVAAEVPVAHVDQGPNPLRSEYTPERWIADVLGAEDPAPGVEYSDAEAKVAAAMLFVETSRFGPPVTWSMLRVPHKRIALALAREFLAADNHTARIVRRLLGL